MGIIDRYVIRQILPPLCLGLLVFTFLIIIPALIEYAEPLIAKGVAAPVVAQLMAMLVPHGLALAIPMSLLLGLLVAFGRLSADREFVAIQACGISLRRLLRPVAVVSLLCWAATSYVLLVSVPAANQNFRELTFSIIAQRAEGDVKPRVFFDGFPHMTLFVREVPASGAGWNGVFLADQRPGQAPAAYMARHGRVLLDRGRRTVEMVLEDGARHTADPTGKYEVFRFERLVLNVDPDTVFPSEGPAKGVNEMTIAELRSRLEGLEREGLPTHNERMAIHRKFSIPIACLVFGLIGLALGATNRRDGTLGSFMIGLIVIFLYYVPLDFGPALAKGGLLPPWLAAWLPNIVLGAVGVMLFIWRDRVADRSIRLALPAVLRRDRPGRGASLVRLPAASILDRYVAQTYGRMLALTGLATAAVFYISTFIDLSDKVFKGDAPWTMLTQYFWFITPQYVYYILPMSVLLATLVTIASLTRSSELIVMKACGISLYRVAVPMLVGAVVAGTLLFVLQETILGPANRRAEAIRHVMRGGHPEQFDVLHRQWIVGREGEIYHYDHYNPRQRQLLGLTVYHFTDGMAGLTRRLFAERAVHAGVPVETSDEWQVERGWIRDFDALGEPKGEFRPFEDSRQPLETVASFETSPPDAKFMTYAQLSSYTERLRASGFDVLEQQVALARKISFPFVTIVMTLIAVPFAVTTGRRGAMAGLGIGIALALTYWTALSVFAAFGAGGIIAPVLAAWAPNLLFAAGAGYLLLTVRT